MIIIEDNFVELGRINKWSAPGVKYVWNAIKSCADQAMISYKE